MSALRSLTYFADIDHSVPIHVVAGSYKWENIEKRLLDMTDEPHRVFQTLP